jgi:hypothetical protein
MRLPLLQSALVMLVLFLLLLPLPLQLLLMPPGTGGMQDVVAYGRSCGGPLCVFFLAAAVTTGPFAGCLFLFVQNR